MRFQHGLGHGLDRRLVIDTLARWWTSASKEERFAYLQRVLDARAPKEKNAPTLEEVRCAIILAEAEAGEICASSS